VIIIGLSLKNTKPPYANTAKLSYSKSFKQSVVTLKMHAKTANLTVLRQTYRIAGVKMENDLRKCCRSIGVWMAMADLKSSNVPRPVVNFTNILQAAFVPVSYYQKLQIQILIREK